MRLISFLVIIIFYGGALNAQQKAVVSEGDKVFDYFSYDYQYLDKDYKIIITDAKFDELVKKYKFYPNRIRSHGDSLSVILSENFQGNWGKVNAGCLRLNYSWTRLSYHLWKTPEETKDLALEYNFTRPYLFKQYLINHSSTESVKNILDELINKLEVNCKVDKDLRSLTTNKLLNFAMRQSPSRILKYKKKAYFREHGKWPDENTKLGETCGKNNCCQKKIKVK